MRLRNETAAGNGTETSDDETLPTFIRDEDNFNRTQLRFSSVINVRYIATFLSRGADNDVIYFKMA